MKMRFLMVLSAIVIPASLFADAASDAIMDTPCEQRSFQYCQLSNVGENCNVGTCESSLSSSGNCTIEAVYNEDGSRISSCRVCSTETINGSACRDLGGSVRSNS